MELKMIPLFSGSSGNAIVVSDGDTALLVDAGVSGSRLSAELARAQLDAHTLCGILITHEHTDHIQGAGVLSRKYNLPLYATEGTWAAMEQKLGALEPANRRTIVPGVDFCVGRINVMPFDIPHDAAQPVGYALSQGALKVAVATDIGCLSDRWICQAAGADLVLLEANHDVDMLKAGRYPYELKRRILGRRGHLSNEDAGRAAARLYREGVRHVILGHLSRENNFPELALKTVSDCLTEEGVAVGEELALDIARRDSMSGVYTLRTGGVINERGRTEGLPAGWRI